MRNLWNSLRPAENSLSRKLVNVPIKLNSVGIKRLIERALWTQGVRSNLINGKKRHEFQTDHGFRKWFKTQSEINGMKPINTEILMGHSVGIAVMLLLIGGIGAISIIFNTAHAQLVTLGDPIFIEKGADTFQREIGHVLEHYRCI